MNKPVRIIGVPMDLGQSRRGVDMGPGAIRYADLSAKLSGLGIKIEDAGNIDVSVRDVFAKPNSPEFLLAIEKACAAAYEAGRKAVSDGFFPLFLGGDHSIAAGTVGGVTHDAPAGVLWIDAHGDFNLPETSPNGNVHGMPVSILLGQGFPGLVDVGRKGPKLKAADIILFGTRDLDYDEKGLLKRSGIKIYTMRDIDERGVAAAAYEALERLKHLPRLHVSLDMDILDPHIAPGVGTPAAGGLTYREAHLLMEILADSGKAGSMDIVEINPVLDTHNQTAKIAVELAASLLGWRIL